MSGRGIFQKELVSSVVGILDGLKLGLECPGWRGELRVLSDNAGVVGAIGSMYSSTVVGCFWLSVLGVGSFLFGQTCDFSCQSCEV